MWSAKLGLDAYNGELLSQLLKLMVQTSVDYTLFFRELSRMPEDMSGLEKSFYEAPEPELKAQWEQWLNAWKDETGNGDDREVLSQQMLRVNPKYTWREWLIVPAYQYAEQGDYERIQTLQQVLIHPYEEQSQATENEFYRLRPRAFFEAGGVSHYSCSS